MILRPRNFKLFTGATSILTIASACGVPRSLGDADDAGTQPEQPGCVIGGVSYASGDRNPANWCEQVCQPQNSSSSWSNVPLPACPSDIASGAANSCAVASGAAYCWGGDYITSNGDAVSLTPRPVVGLPSGVTSVTVDWYGGRFCALASGNAYCWAVSGNTQGGNGSLGNGSNDVVPTPVQVQGLPSGVQAITTSSKHSCAIANGAAYCWGSNNEGQLGDGTRIDRLTAVPVLGLSDGVQSMSATSDETCAVRDGITYCWGTQNYAGPDTQSQQHIADSPMAVPGLGSNAESVVVGVTTLCSIANGAAYCWGPNWEGMSGNGTMNWSAVPVPVVGFGDSVQGIAIAEYNTCGLKANRTYCWGRSIAGEIGDAGSSDSLTPVLVDGLPPATRLSMGYDFVCVISTGHIYCMGKNDQGQLGNNSRVDSLKPVQVVGL